MDSKKKTPWFVRNFIERPEIALIVALLVIFFIFGMVYYLQASASRFGAGGSVGQSGAIVPSIFPAIVPTLITTCAIVFSAIWATAFAGHNINKTRETAKLQETLKMINDAELDDDYIKAKTTWSRYRSVDDHDKEFSTIFAIFYLDGLPSVRDKVGTMSGEGSEICRDGEKTDSEREENRNNGSMSSPNNDKTIREIQKDVQLIMTYLNHFEIIALAIEEGIIDEEFYKKWHGTMVVRTWNYSVGAIGAARTLQSNQKLYVNWENLVKRWHGEYFMEMRPVVGYTVPQLAGRVYDNGYLK